VQRIVKALCIGMLILALTGVSLVMDGKPVSSQDAPEASPFDNLAVALVIDVSGSMSYTDPLRLRETAAGMFIDLLGAEDLLSVITFDHEAELVQPFGPAGSPAAKEALMGRLSPRLDPRGDTDFVEALKLALAQFKSADTGDKVPVILFLTDGEPDPFPGAIDDEAFMAEYMESLWEQVGLLAGEGILVYTVAFSDEIDPEVVRRISTDTRGQYYILAEPSELLVTFYRALEALKDRRSFLEESVDLGSGGSHTFSFSAEEFTRQVNLVLVGDSLVDDGAMEVTVKPPAGAPGQIEELMTGGRDNYLSVILSRPQERHYGRWEVEVSGSGQIQALGNSDFYLEALLIDPAPGASYPLDEPLEIRVEVITREKYEGELFDLKMQLTAPGSTRPELVPLERDGNSFWGIYEPVDLQGEYELSWQLYRGEEEIFGSSALVTVQQLPALKTDFWSTAEGFRLGEEMVVSASLTSRGERMQQGPHLQVDSFILNLEYRDGARIEVELFDSGDRAHGNSRAGDGIWSNRLLFDREGAATAFLTASGSYRDSNFVLKKNFGFSVAGAGSVSARLQPEDLWAQPGGTLEVPLAFISESPFTQTVRISSPVDEVSLLQDRVAVPPGETVPFMLEALIEEAVEPGRFYITMEFEAEDGMTPVQPEILDFEVQILSGGEAFRRKFSGLGIGIGIIGAAALLLIGLVFGGGSLANRYYLERRLRVNGHLLFRPEGDNPGPEAEAHKLDLSRLAKSRVVVSFGPESGQSDYVIPSSGYSFDLVISNSWNDHLPRFVRGWKALLKRSLNPETAANCTPPGIMVVNGQVYTGRELRHGDQFETGGFIFKYHSGSEKGSSRKGRGVNILEGKE
jgi:Mg-chelatase subunit ChlD